MPFWDYFLAIEQDLAECTRYVQFGENFGENSNQDNYKTFSLEFARIIVASGAECDTVMKKLYKSICGSEAPDILRRFAVLNSAYPTLVRHEIEIPKYSLSFTPWETWSSDNSPDWWGNAYDKIKHERDVYFVNANLRNAILATAGLLCTLMYYYRELESKHLLTVHFDISESPRLLSPKHYGSWTEASISWGYDFPDE
jgi:hypothetical protein